MLPRLLLRDALLHGRMLLISYGIFAAFQLYLVLRVDSSRAWLVFASIYASFLAITVFAREDKFQSTAWTLTLPVTRRDVVRARFLEAWILVVAALVAATILAVVIPRSQVELSVLIQPESLLMAATVITAVVALMLPFLIRFGLLGMMIFLVGAQVLGAGLLVAAVALRGRGGGLRLGFSAIADAVRAAHGALPHSAFYALALAFLVAVNWAGYRLAVRLFRGRDL